MLCLVISPMRRGKACQERWRDPTVRFPPHVNLAAVSDGQGLQGADHPPERGAISVDRALCCCVVVWPPAHWGTALSPNLASAKSTTSGHPWCEEEGSPWSPLHCDPARRGQYGPSQRTGLLTTLPLVRSCPDSDSAHHHPGRSIRRCPEGISSIRCSLARRSGTPHLLQAHNRELHSMSSQHSEEAQQSGTCQATFPPKRCLAAPNALHLAPHSLRRCSVRKLVNCSYRNRTSRGASSSPSGNIAARREPSIGQPEDRRGANPKHG